MLRKSLLPFMLLLCTAPLLAQYGPPPGSNPSMRAGRRGNVAPCMQQAGIDSSKMEQLRTIQRDARSQVEGVCSNSSLSPEQKRQQVEEIHQQAHQKIEGLLTADQQKALAACRQQHGQNHPGMGNFEGVGGGCGGARPGAGSTNGNPPSPNQSSPQ